MQVEVVMPKMGESIQEGKILKWLKNPGDIIERDEIILEISTDKVDTEVPSPSAGKLVSLQAAEGDTVEVGKVIAIIETDVNASVSTPAPAPVVAAPVVAPTPVVEAIPIPVAAAPVVSAPTPVAAPAPVSGGTEVVMPKMGESIQEGKILKWLKKPGDTVERDEILLEISTDKVDTEVPSPVAGTISAILANEGDTVEVGKVIAMIGGSVTASAPVVAPTPVVSAPVVAAPVVAPAPVVSAPVAPIASAPVVSSEKRFYSPLVKTIAQTENISQAELDSIKGSGLEGRVTKNDVLGYLAQRGSKPVSAPVVSAPAAVPAPASSATSAVSTPATVAAPKPAVLSNEQIYKKYGQDVEIIPMDNMRQIISEHMVRSKSTSAHVTSVMEADVTEIVRLRDKFKGSFEKKEGMKLTFTPFFLSAAIEGVRAFPKVNVSVEGKNIIQHKHINLGFATALDDGNLIVPVIKDADALNITGLQRAVTDLSTRARSKKLSPMEIQGGTFSVTNVGTFGTLFGTPVINQPNVAIMGIGAIQKRPVVKEVAGNDLILVRHMVYVSITYDHRVVDGMLAGQCLAKIVSALESYNENTVRL